MKSRAPSGVRLDQVGRLDLDEAVGVMDLADRLDEPAAQEEPLAHRLAPDVEVAVAQAQGLVDRGVGVVDVERRRLRLRQDRDRRRPGARSRRSPGAGSPSPRSRAATSPSTVTTNSLRTRLATAWASGCSVRSTTTWVIPWRSRRSRKISWPWSRRRWTQPDSRAVVPGVGGSQRRRRCGSGTAWRGSRRARRARPDRAGVSRSWPTLSYGSCPLAGGSHARRPSRLPGPADRRPRPPAPLLRGRPRVHDPFARTRGRSTTRRAAGRSSPSPAAPAGHPAPTPRWPSLVDDVERRGGRRSALAASSSRRTRRRGPVDGIADMGGRPGGLVQGSWTGT